MQQEQKLCTVFDSKLLFFQAEGKAYGFEWSVKEPLVGIIITR